MKTTTKTEAETDLFLQELTELCHAHGLGIAGNPALFILESDDVDRKFTLDEESKLAFA